ncbi:hypothetical protein X979_2029 [Burkholderia pseudomallei MSHR7527]|uniref:hypothetical protein n=1 Tax=Burkholderia pseudomallei TaxID=28450 RepID=UPI000531260F|nr:hypothetical protein [Burkholderia pseudomallei]KGS64542.1 hypothetical protein X979_2029 [Burkholderia pseudomallei MSHR7527]
MKRTIIAAALLLTVASVHAQWSENQQDYRVPVQQDYQPPMQTGAFDTQGTYYAPAGPNGLINTQSGAYMSCAPGGCVNTQTGQFLPGY